MRYLIVLAFVGVFCGSSAFAVTGPLTITMSGSVAGTYTFSEAGQGAYTYSGIVGGKELDLELDDVSTIGGFGGRDYHLNGYYGSGAGASAFDDAPAYVVGNSVYTDQPQSTSGVFSDSSVFPLSVPEPSTLAAFFLVPLGLLWRRRSKVGSCLPSQSA